MVSCVIRSTSNFTLRHFYIVPLSISLLHCMKRVHIRCIFWSAFSSVRTEYRDLRSKSLYSVRGQENTDQKILHIWVLFKQCCLHVLYTNRLFGTPGFKRILPQNKLVLIEKYVHFVDIAELGDTYSRPAKIEPIHSYLIERWQSLLTLKCEVSVDKTLLHLKDWLSWK